MLPCMLPPNVGNRALDELVAYRRLKDRANNVCSDCMKESRRKVKRCAKCGDLYDEENGRIVTDDEEVQSTLEQLQAELEAERQGAS